MRPRFSLTTLMAFILACGIGCAALLNPSALVASAVFTLTDLILLVAILCIAYYEPPRRYFWLGFAVLGWGHQILAFWPEFDIRYAPRILTTRIVDIVMRLINAGYARSSNYVNMLATKEVYGVWKFHIIHSLISLFIAFISGLITQLVFVSRDRRRAKPSTEG